MWCLRVQLYTHKEINIYINLFWNWKKNDCVSVFACVFSRCCFSLYIFIQFGYCRCTLVILNMCKRCSTSSSCKNCSHTIHYDNNNNGNKKSTVSDRASVCVFVYLPLFCFIISFKWKNALSIPPSGRRLLNYVHGIRVMFEIFVYDRTLQFLFHL